MIRSTLIGDTVRRSPVVVAVEVADGVDADSVEGDIEVAVGAIGELPQAAASRATKAAPDGTRVTAGLSDLPAEAGSCI